MSFMREGPHRGARRWASIAAAVAMTLGTGTMALAAGETDVVSNVELGVSCSANDDKAVHLRFHVESQAGTPADQRITEVAFSHSGVDDGPYFFQSTAPGEVGHFETGDHELLLSWYVLRSTLEGDVYDVEILRANGEVAAAKAVTVACYDDGGEGAIPHDFAVKARLGVPRTFRLLEHVTFGGGFGDAGWVTHSWVSSPGATLDVLEGVDDILELDTATSAALRATLSKDPVPPWLTGKLTVYGAQAGTYVLDWGVVTNKTEGTSIEIVEDPQDVWIPYPQWIQTVPWEWVWDVEPECVPDGDLAWICSGGVGHQEGGERVWVEEPQWVSIASQCCGSLWVTTGETKESHGPAALTIEVIDGPIQPDDSQIVEESRGNVSAPDEVPLGGDFSIDVGQESAGGYVDVWLHSDPVYLGLFPVSSNGTVQLTVPANFVAGDHRVVVTDEVGEFIGWDDVEVAVLANNQVPKGDTGLDEEDLALRVVGLGAGLLALAGIVVVAGRRARGAK